jgi:hypothetical protein
MSYVTKGLILVSVLLLSPDVGAWEQDTECTTSGDKWSTSTFNYRISTTDFPSSGSLYTGLEEAGLAWGNGSGSPIPGTDLDVYKGIDTTVTTHDPFDNANTVTLESVPSGKIAYVTDRCSGSLQVECDVWFDHNQTWHGGIAHKQETGFSIRSVFIHELGHCLGYAHENDFEDTMNSNYPLAGNTGGKADITENSREGARDVYPDSSTGTDLALSTLRKNNTTGDTSWIPHSEGGVVEVTSAAAGSTITRAYCMHNLGTSTEYSVKYRIYLSTDSDIETTDTVLFTSYPSLSPDTPYCDAKTMTIPSSTSSGTYWVGAIIDSDNSVSETSESNNTVKDTQSFTVY